MQVRPDLKEEMAATKEQAAREERLRVALARLSASSSHVDPPSAAPVSPVQRRKAPSEVAGGGVGALGSPSGGAERAMLAAAAIAPPPQAEQMACLMVEIAEAEDELTKAEGTAEVLEYMHTNIAALRTDLRRAKERGEAERDHLTLVIARVENEREHARSQAQQAVHELNRAREREAKRSAQRAARLAKLRKEQELAHRMATDPKTVQPHPLLVKLEEEKHARLDAATAVAARDAAEGHLENASKQAKVEKQLAKLEHAFAQMSLRVVPDMPLRAKLRHVVEFVRNGDRTVQVQVQETSARRDRLATQLLEVREALAQWQVGGGGGSGSGAVGSGAEGSGAMQGREGGEAGVAGINQPAVSVSTANVVAATAAPTPPVGCSPLWADELEEVRLQARREAEARVSEVEERHDRAQKLAERALQQLQALHMALANSADWTVGAIRRVEREVREQRETMKVAAVEANESAEAVRPHLPSASPNPMYHLPSGSPRRRQRSSIQRGAMHRTVKGAALTAFEHGQLDGAVTSASPSASSPGSPSSVFLTAVADPAEVTEERAGSLDRASRLSSMQSEPLDAISMQSDRASRLSSMQRGAAKGAGGAMWSFGGSPVPAPTAAADDDDGDDDDDDRARISHFAASVAAPVPATVTGGNYSDALGICDEFDEEEAERDGVEPLARLEQALAALMVVATPLLDAREGEEYARAAAIAAAAHSTAAREAPTKTPTKAPPLNRRSVGSQSVDSQVAMALDSAPWSSPPSALNSARTSAHSSPTVAWPLPEGEWPLPPASSYSLQAPPAPSTAPAPPAPAPPAPSTAPQLSASLSASSEPRAVASTRTGQPSVSLGTVHASLSAPCMGAAPSEPRAVASTRTGQPSPSLGGVVTTALVATPHPSSPPAGATHVAALNTAHLTATPSPSARRRGADKAPPFSREELKAASAKVLRMGKTRDAHKRAPPTPAQLKASRAALEYIKLARSAGASSGACFKTNLALVRLKAAATDHWGRPQTIPHLGKDLATSKSELLWMERPSPSAQDSQGPFLETRTIH